MNFPWRSVKGKDEEGSAGASYCSDLTLASRTVPGVVFTIGKMSFGRRVELMRRVRELARRADFLAASKDPCEKMDAALLQAEVDREYVVWGVKSIKGLTVDGREAGAELLAAAGPEPLFREALAAVRRETGLNEEERKNS